MRDKKAVEAYRRRRMHRLRARFDADEDERNRNGVSHGNTRLPFGLCQREGIAIDPKWSPKDAWNALEGEGYSAKEAYKELKETGHVAKKSAKKSSVKMEEKHFPPAMTGKAYKKNTMEMAKFINDHCDDPDVMDFLGSAMGEGRKEPTNVRCVRSASGEGCHIAPDITMTTDETTGDQVALISGLEIRVPMLSQFKDQSEKEQAIRSFCHEWAHYLDMLARDGEGFGMFTDKDEKLQAVLSGIEIESIKGKISDEVMEKFRVFNEKEEEYIKESKEQKKNVWRTVAEQMYGTDEEEWPGWIEKRECDFQGEVVYYYGAKADKYGRTAWSDRENVKKYERLLKKAKKDVAAEYAKKMRAFGDGVSSLQGIYDAMSCGNLKANDIVKYGHRESYFSGGRNRATEMIADYIALKATNKEMADMFVRNFPDIAKALDEAVVRITKRLRGGT